MKTLSKELHRRVSVVSEEDSAEIEAMGRRALEIHRRGWMRLAVLALAWVASAPAIAQPTGLQERLRILAVEPEAVVPGTLVDVVLTGPVPNEFYGPDEMDLVVKFGGFPARIHQVDFNRLLVVVPPELARVAGDWAEVSVEVGGADLRSAGPGAVTAMVERLRIVQATPDPVPVGAEVILILSSRSVPWAEPTATIAGLPAKYVNFDFGALTVEVPRDLKAGDYRPAEGTSDEAETGRGLARGPEVRVFYQGVPSEPFRRLDVVIPVAESPSTDRFTVFGLSIKDLALGYLIVGGLVWLVLLRTRRREDALRSQVDDLMLTLDNLGKGTADTPQIPRDEDEEGDASAPAPPEALVAACLRRDCVLFGGGGIGAQAGFPTWRLGLAKMLDRLEQEEDPERWSRLRETLSRGDPETVAELIEGRLKPERLVSLVEEVYGGKVEKLPDACAAMRDLGFFAVLSSNWDRVLEKTFNVQSPLSPRDTQELLRRYRDGRFFMLKLFGDPSESHSFVFTYEQYRHVASDNEDFKKLIRSLLGSKTFLFAGSSLSWIEDFAAGFRPQQDGDAGQTSPAVSHFALVPWQSDIELQQERFARKYGIELLPFHPTQGFPQLSDFFGKLRDEVKDHSGVVAKRRIRPATLDRVVLANIGAFTYLDRTFERGWNVLLGNNGCGKTTLLRAIALGLCGDDVKAEQTAWKLLRTGEDKGRIELWISGRHFRTDLERDGTRVRTMSKELTPLQTGNWVVLGFPPLRGVSTQDPRSVTKEEAPNPTVEDLLPLLSGDVDSRMDNIKQWIVHVSSIAEGGSDVSSRDQKRYQRLRDKFFNILDRLTPKVPLKFKSITKRPFRVMVETVDGVVSIDLVSQGMGSLLAWVGTLLQRMYEIHGESDEPENEPALVLVDELAAHMHPEWQRLFVRLLQQEMPRLQVVATTHSPLVIGGIELAAEVPAEKSEATDKPPGPEARDKPRPSQVLFMTRESKTGQVMIEKVEESFRGWRADQILTGPAFGMATTIDDYTTKEMEDYYELLGTSQLSPEKQAQFEDLAARLDRLVPTHQQTKQARETLKLVHECLLEKLAKKAPEEQAEILGEAEKALAFTIPREEEAI